MTENIVEEGSVVSLNFENCSGKPLHLSPTRVNDIPANNLAFLHHIVHLL